MTVAKIHESALMEHRDNEEKIYEPSYQYP